MQYTPDQEKAIHDDPAGNILVSASAGSGKTRVLVDRIINDIENKHMDVDQLLVVTFTRAAAKEMRERLTTSLRERFSTAEDQDLKRHLLTQIQKLSVADITTLDAFCQKLITRYYYVLGIDPNFRILADDTEKELLKDQVWGNVREDLYGADDDNTFAELTENFSSDRSDDGLTELVYRLNDFANVNVEPDEWLAKLPDFYRLPTNGLTKSDLYINQIAPEIRSFLQQILMDAKLGVRLADEGGNTKDFQYFEKLNDAFEGILTNFAEYSWDELKTTITEFELGRMPSARKNDGTDIIAHKQVQEIRQEISKTMGSISNYFAYNEVDNLAIMASSKKRVEKLVEVIQEFRRAYYEQKSQRHLMEFIDIEHAAYDILTDESDQAGVVQKRLRDQYQEIMVDEYQDNNRLQDAILNEIAHKDHGNRFMVGDVKQSIYRFRLADPSMFVTKQSVYADDNNDNELISLAENFRSTRNIDSFVNLVFKQVMDSQFGEIDYAGDALLKFGANYYPKGLPAHIELLLYNSKQAPAENDDEYQIDDSNQGQVEIIAKKIRSLIAKGQEIFDPKLKAMRPITYGDIAVISPTHSNELVMADIFGGYQIPAEINGAKSYFKATEVRVMMAMMAIIDNPFQDIPMVAVLKSPIVGLDENQLAYLRINRKTGNYYQAVRDFYNNYGQEEPNAYAQSIYPRIKTFLEQLTQFKDVAQQQGIVSLIWDIYNTTGYLDYVGGLTSGIQRQTNLHALYSRAAEYEKNGFKGLFQFVLYIKRMQDRDEDLAIVNPVTTADVVHVMTIHSSKGLQFPIVFLNDIDKKFNFRDMSDTAVLNDRLGIGISYFKTDTREIQNSLERLAIIDVERNAALAEEMRKLYVALTRAEQQLYLVGKNSSKDEEQVIVEKWQSETQADSLQLPIATRKHARSYLDWIGPAISRHHLITKKYETGSYSPILNRDPTKFELHFFNDEDIYSAEKDPEENSQRNEQWVNDQLDEKQNINVDFTPDDPKWITNVMNYKYPYQSAVNTSAYQSVSEIKRLFDDPDNLELGGKNVIGNAVSVSRFVQPQLNKPQFLSAEEMSQPSPTEIGTATHLILQNINLFEQPTIESVTNLLETFIKQGSISKPVATKIDLASVVNFFNSDIGTLMLANPQATNREIPFSLLIKANDVFSDFDNDPENRVLIHGIIDAYITVGQHAYLLDYKTDKLTKKTTVESVVDRYRGQIRLYELALHHILNNDQVTKYLYLLADDKLVKVE